MCLVCRTGGSFCYFCTAWKAWGQPQSGKQKIKQQDTHQERFLKQEVRHQVAPQKDEAAQTVHTVWRMTASPTNEGKISWSYWCQ